MNPEDGAITQQTGKNDNNSLVFISSAIVIAVIFIGIFVSLLLNKQKKPANYTNPFTGQTSQTQNVASQNPFVQPTAPYQNPFSQTQNQTTNQPYQNPFGGEQ